MATNLPPKTLTTAELLREILACLNQIPNRRVNNYRFTNTYEICSEIENHLKTLPD